MMENYSKGKNVEEELVLEKVPIPNLPQDVIWMQVNGGTKMRNVLGFAMKELESPNKGAILWTGTDAGLGKAISCAEICKRKHQFHQITKICHRKVEEYWEPLIKELETLVVTREIPVIHILLSRNPLDVNEPGYQAPGSYGAFWKSTTGPPGGRATKQNTTRDYLKQKKRPSRGKKESDDYFNVTENEKSEIKPGEL